MYGLGKRVTMHNSETFSLDPALKLDKYKSVA